ncbi:MAG: hemolysin III family protein [Flavobacteriales bacterium]|nr:hemolysin III family protein [Flavobacteriales bacterium]
MNEYSRKEERLNVLTHLFGVFASFVALALSMIRAVRYQDTTYTISVLVFVLTMMLLYIASTTYHNAKDPRIRHKLKIFDHCAIYVLIAGTYTPFSLVTLKDTSGMTIFYTIWSLAIFGVLFKIFFTGRFKLLSTIIYVLMGWLIIFYIDDLINSFSVEGLTWMMIGGAAYSIGAILYMIKKIPYNHAIFHVFVLLGTFSHFISVYQYVLPR